MRARDWLTDYTIATSPIGALRRLLNTVRVPTGKRCLQLLRRLREILGTRMMAMVEQSREGWLEK